MVTDGLEANFTLHYRRPTAGDAQVRAKYFEGIEQLNEGAFVAMDENRNVFGNAVLSRTNDRTELALPKLAVTETVPTAMPASLSLIAVPRPMPLPAPGMLRGFVAGINITPGIAVDALILAVSTTLLASLYPSWRASRLVIVDALRHNR